MEPALLAALAELLPELHSLHPGLPVEELPLERARQRLFEATARAFELLGKQRPLCVVLEDLHWAGPATLSLLESLARRVGTLQVLLVATFRPDHGPGATRARNLRARLVQERRALTFALKPLSTGDVLSIVEAAEDASPARDDLASRIATLSEGNPLFVTQLLEGYRETHAMPDESTAISTVNDAILSRMDRLDEQVRAVAEAAATFGESFTADFIAAAGGWPENDVLDAIGELMDRSLVRESGGGALEYTFTHALIAGALYRSSAPSARVARHRRIARVLERHSADDARRLAEIARHWEMAGEKERASDLYLRAAHAAISLYARDEAIARARKALELGLDAERSFQAYLLISRAQLGSGVPEQWNADIEELERLAKELGDEQTYAALEERHVFYRQTGEGLLRQGAIQKQLALAEKAFPEKRAAALANLGMSQLATARLEEAAESMARSLAAADVSDAATRALAREGLVQALLRLGRRDEALAEIEAMRADRSILATPALRRRLLNAQVSLALATEDMDLAIETGNELLALALQMGDAFAEMHARQILAYGSQYRSDVDTVREHMDTTIRICERIGAKDNYRALLSDSACYERYLGRADAALALLERSLEMSNDTFDSTTVAYGVLEKSHVFGLLGRHEEGYEMAREALQRAERIRERRLLAASKAAAGVALTALGRADEALEYLAYAVNVWREDEMIAPLCNDLCSYANALVAAGRIPEAVETAAELRRLSEQYPRKQWYPSRIQWAMAIVSRAAGDEAAARRYETMGRNSLTRELTRLGNEEGAAAYAALPFNRALVSA
jgi:predicted ATPase